ncbi:MAG TPA: Gfo/Idh/MocA family oxidoreductase [Vicinamibacterales bacterium]|nr:Gfo/Idh/MocA family oxidoreductase [Vicinamibacterales bacterium]
MKPLRWGILSTARINRAIVPALRVSGRHELVALASRQPERARECAREWAIPRAYGSYDELLADRDIDAIYNPLPNSLHAEWTIRAAKAGKHVLCEKPLAITTAEVEAIADAAARAGVVAAEAFMYRHHPQTLRVKALIDEGAIGDLQLIRSAFTFTLTRPGDVRLDPALGGGSLWDVGCYPVSLSRYLTGREPRRVYGVQVLGPTGIDLSFYGYLDFGGVQAQFDCGFISPLRTRLEIVGSKGAISVNAPFKPGTEEQIVITRDEGTETLTVSGGALYAGQMDDFADAVQRGVPPRIPLSDSRATVAAIEALYRSAREDRLVEL